MTYETLRMGLHLDRGLIPNLTSSEVSRVRLGGRRFISLNHPDAAHHILTTSRLKYIKSNEYEAIGLAAGINLLTDEGDSWSKHRAILNPKFSKRNLDEIFDSMVDPIDTMVKERLNQVGLIRFDMHEEMVQMTLRVVANSLFSQDFGEIVENMNELATKGLHSAEILLRVGLVGLIPSTMWRLLSKLAYSRLPTPPPFAAIQEVAKGLEIAVNNIVDERIANPTNTSDLLNMLLKAENGTLPKQRIRDEALTFMLAGHETTANALSWFWYLMAINPTARNRMLAEVDSVLGDKRITSAHLAHLPWTTACIQESQRYFSAVPMILRTAIEDDIFSGHLIRRGTSVLIPIQAIHHDTRFWDEPSNFNPERFLQDSPKPYRSSFLPFGGGRRVCIGQSFALMEMVAIASTMSQHFTFDLVPAHPVIPAQSLTLRPKYGIHMLAKPRIDTISKDISIESEVELATTCPVPEGHR
ncbi:MAG: cytochrome P450 [Mycobacteriaceae bacterium]